MTDFGRRVAVAAANVLPKTGQTIPYHPGDDGTYQAGWEGERFTDNGDGTITDNATGLMWIKDALDPAINMTSREWEDQIDHIEALEYAGHADWRMPNAHELQSLVDFTQPLATFNPLFLNISEGQWWTSMTWVDDIACAVTLYVPWYFVDYVIKTEPVGKKLSLCVREI